jgi:hypothetical protein
LSGLGTGLGSSLGLGDGTSLLGGLGTTLGQVAPYAAVGALGMKQAADGRANDQKYVNQLTSLGQPMVDQSNKLLQNYNSNTLNPQDSALLKQANTLASQINSNSSGLSDIAKTAFANYASGKLSPGDQATLDAQVASQKQQVASQLASAGITDSTILAGQYAQIDNQALITKQSLLNAQFATGNQAYDSYLNGTNEGQAILTTATQTADTSLQNELNSAVSTFGAGANVITTGIQTAMAADANYSKQVSDLLGTLASAYAKQYMSGSGSGSGGSAGNAAAKGAAGAAGGQLGNLAIKAANGNAGLDSNLVTGGGQSPATSADTGAINADIGASTPDLSLSDFNNQSNFNDWTSNLTVPDVSLPDGVPP